MEAKPVWSDGGMVAEISLSETWAATSCSGWLAPGCGAIGRVGCACGGVGSGGWHRKYVGGRIGCMTRRMAQCVWGAAAYEGQEERELAAREGHPQVVAAE
eukprot:6835194-Prymnesium_polylepis.1